jgi:hypothetical protein
VSGVDRGSYWPWSLARQGSAESIQNGGTVDVVGVRFWAHGKRIDLLPKLVWRVKFVAELRPGEVTETEVALMVRMGRANTLPSNETFHGDS